MVHYIDSTSASLTCDLVAKYFTCCAREEKDVQWLSETRPTNWPEGTISDKTLKSIQMLSCSLRRLARIQKKISQAYT